MIHYNPGKWHIWFIFTLKGSVFPTAFAWALPSTIFACLLHSQVEQQESKSLGQIYSGFSFVIGFLVVFRTQQAYSRYWEGATLLKQVRGAWFNATSSLFAFCSSAVEKHKEVEQFQNLLVRLMSLLHCCALQRIAILEDEDFPVLDLEGVDSESLFFLTEKPNEKCFIILQWIQRLIMENMSNGVATVPAPILSRVFQELAQGIVSINDAEKLTEILFPFPYAQMVGFMLLTTTIITPIAAATMVWSPFWCGGMTFVTVFAFWSINYIAAEIEVPFGDDANDLPISELQKYMNDCLCMLLDRRAQVPPKFEFNPERCAPTPSIISASAMLEKNRLTKARRSGHDESPYSPATPLADGPPKESCMTASCTPRDSCVTNMTSIAPRDSYTADASVCIEIPPGSPEASRSGTAATLETFSYLPASAVPVANSSSKAGEGPSSPDKAWKDLPSPCGAKPGSSSISVSCSQQERKELKLGVAGFWMAEGPKACDGTPALEAPVNEAKSMVEAELMQVVVRLEGHFSTIVRELRNISAAGLRRPDDRLSSLQALGAYWSTANVDVERHVIPPPASYAPDPAICQGMVL